MPVYEFDCTKCRAPFQSYVPRMSWKDLRCPKCGSAKIEKKISRFAVMSASGEDSDFGSDPDVSGGESAECSGDPSNCDRCDLDE